jgi:HD-like signal output (HDOD) protein
MMRAAYSPQPSYVPRRDVPEQPGYLQPLAPSSPAQRLLDQLSPDTQLTGLGIAVLRIVRLAESGDRAVQELSQALLADPFIAQKVIRSANAVAAQRGTAPVTTVSRAIVVLGLDQVRSIASSTALLDHLQDRKQAAHIQEEFAQTLYATTLARSLASARPGVDPEEAAVCTMFRSFGRLMAAMYLHGPYEEAVALTGTDELSEGQAAAQTLGMGFNRLGIEVLNRWRLPERITQAALPCPALVRAASSPHAVLRILAEFCTETADAVREGNLRSRRHRIELLLERYGDGLGLHRRQLRQALRDTDERARELGDALGIFGTGAAGDCLEDANLITLSPSNRAGASLTLSAGVASLSRMLERHQSPEAICTHALQVLRRAFDFQRVVLSEYDRSAGGYRITHLAGKSLHVPQAQFAFAMANGPDLFTAALQKNADVYIREAADASLQKALPRWYRAACPDARSFLLLPIQASDATIGFVYADYTQSNARRLTAEEVEILKTLKTQIAIALRQAKLLVQNALA